MAEIKSKKTINSGLLMMLIVILVAFFITYLVSAFFMLEKNRNDYGIRESEAIINGVAGNVSSSIGTYKNLSRLVMVNQEAVVFLKADEANPSNVNDARYGVMDVMNATSSLDSIFIFRNDGNYMKTGKGLYDIDTELLNTDEWRGRILDKRGGAIIMINAGDVVNKKNGEPTVTVARAIYDINSQKLIGMLLMNFSTLMLDEAINSQDDQYICIVSTEGKYLSGDEEMAKYFNKEFVSDSVVHLPMAIGGKRGMVSGYRIPDTPLVVVCYTNSQVSVFTNTTIYALLSIMLVFIIGTLYAAKYITKNITTPITELTSAIERTKKSDYLEKLDVEVPENEIGTLSESYNGMVDHVNQLFNELIEKEKSVQRAEMRVLHEQIKPHFLYNTLGTIGYMALCDGADDVHEALETLGSFYRNFLSKGDRDIPLSREISIIKRLPCNSEAALWRDN